LTPALGEFLDRAVPKRSQSDCHDRKRRIDPEHRICGADQGGRGSPGVSKAAAVPWMVRKPISQPTDGARAQATEAAPSMRALPYVGKRAADQRRKRQ
jgi:hypothetical protein